MSESDQNLEGTQPFDEEEVSVAVVDTHGLFSGNQAGDYVEQPPYGGQPYGSQGGYSAQPPYNGQPPYGNQPP